MAHAQRRLENAGVLRNFTFEKDGVEYRVFETTTKRTQDLFRFELWKPESEKPYVVSFQTEDGRVGACDCPAGKFHRNHGDCKHIKMCRMEFMTSSGNRTQSQRTGQDVPAPKPRTAKNVARPTPMLVQTSLPGLDPKEALVKELKDLRASYAQKRDLRDSLDKELDLLARQGSLLKERIGKL